MPRQTSPPRLYSPHLAPAVTAAATRSSPSRGTPRHPSRRPGSAPRRPCRRCPGPPSPPSARPGCSRGSGGRPWHVIVKTCESFPALVLTASHTPPTCKPSSRRSPRRPGCRCRQSDTEIDKNKSILIMLHLDTWSEKSQGCSSLVGEDSGAVNRSRLWQSHSQKLVRGHT